MPAAVANDGLGTVLAFTTSTELNSATGLEMTDLSYDGGTGTSFETTNYSTPAEGSLEMGNRTFKASRLVDGGSMSIEYSFNPDVRIRRGITDTLLITWPDGGTWSFSAIVESVSGAMPMAERNTVNITVKVASKITIVAAA